MENEQAEEQVRDLMVGPSNWTEGTDPQETGKFYVQDLIELIKRAYLSGMAQQHAKDFEEGVE